MYQFYLECELVKPVFDYFIKQGYNVRFEVRIGYCIADLVAFKDGKATAVELKLKDRKKAIIQAKNYQLGADYVYLAFPLDSIYGVMRKSEHFLTCEGIGLFAVNEKTCKVSEILAASCSLKNMGSVTFGEGYRYRRNGFINRF